MANATGARHSMGYAVESVAGTTPSNPVFKPIRHNTTNLGLSKTTIQSAELRGDRQIADVRHGNYNVAGDIVADLSYGSFDDLLEAVFGGTWAPTATKTATTISAAAIDNSFSDSGNGFVAAGFAQGQHVTVTGFGGGYTANNIVSGVIATLTAGKMTIAATIGDAIVDCASGSSITITTDEKTLKAGVVRRSFSIERHFSDIAEYLRYRGCEFDKFSMSVKPNAMVTATFGAVGRDADPASSSALSGATYPAATTTSAMDSFSGTLLENGTQISVVTEISLNIVNGISPLFVVGQKGAADMAIGRFQVNAQVTAFFDSVTLLNKFINETESNLTFETVGSGGMYRWTLPRIKYNGGQPDVGGEGSITLAMPLFAMYDSTAGTSLKVEKVPA